MTRPAISVVVVTWQSRDVLPACLESLATQQISGDLEVIVVDNGSSDGTADLATTEFPWVRVIANPANRGLAAANNQGLIASSGDMVVFCGPDVVFEPAALAGFAELLARRPRAAFVVPQVRLSDGALQSTAGDLPTLGEALLGRQLAHRRSRPGQTTGFCWDGWAHDEERLVGRAGDVGYAVRRVAAAEAGLLDERFPLDWEAIDWSARVRSCGWEIWFTPQAQLRHTIGSSTSKAHPVRWVVSTHRGMYAYFRNRNQLLMRPILAALFASRALIKIAAIAVKVPMHARSTTAQRVLADAQPELPGQTPADRMTSR